MMPPLDRKHRWMFVVEIAMLLIGIFLKNSTCESSGTNLLMFVSTKKPDGAFRFPSKVVYHENNGSKLCFKVNGTKGMDADCCHREFSCSFEVWLIKNYNYSLSLNAETLSKQNIVLMTEPEQNFSCMPSKFYSKTSGFLPIHDCLNKVTSIKLSQNDLSGKCATYDEEACKGLAETQYNVNVMLDMKSCVPCKLPGKKPDITITVPPPESNNGPSSSLENEVNIMNNVSFYLEQMGHYNTAAIVIGDIKGMISKLNPKDQANINLGVTTNGDMDILENNAGLGGNFSLLVKIPKVASDMAVKGKGSFVAMMLFAEKHQDDPNSFFLNNEIVGIEMGTEISNLSHTVDIHYRNVDKKGNIASCRSWDGKGKKAIWIRDGCQTKETNDSITCQCSHLTFFAILMSPSPGNMSSSDFTSLTYITSIGCGLSVFFLAVALFMHCLIRKRKASQATQIIINLFVAMFTLNLSFLTNESIANLGNFEACVVVAAVLHYTILATFTWFLIEGLHLYFNLWKFPSTIKHYMMKICITGWVTPAVVVAVLLALGKYDYIVIYIDDGHSAKMCWISDVDVLQGVNVGFYAVVFIFNIVIFIITVRQIVMFKHTKGKAQDIGSIKTNSFSILGLFLLLGITWAFAFFSHGPLLIPSYYIFTILNSLQGVFLLIYYYNSSKIVGEDRGLTVSSSSTATSNTAVTSQYE